MISAEDEILITNAIALAEKNTSGEIRVHIETKCKIDPVEQVKKLFAKLKMYETKDRNGVLIYVALKDHKLAIWGDEGIHQKLPNNFWEDETQLMIRYFSENKIGEGLAQAIHLIGEQLKQHFPYQSNDTNELSNEVSFGD